MTRLVQVEQRRGAVQPARRIDFGVFAGQHAQAGGRQLLGHARRRQCQVEARQALDVGRHIFGSLADDTTEAPQDALDLALLLDLQLTPAVREVDHGERLDEQRCAAGRDIVHDAAHLAAKVGFDRNDVATIAQGNQRLLRRQTPARRAEELLELRLQTVVGHLDVAPDHAQRGAGAVHDVASLVDRLADLVDHLLSLDHRRAESAETWQRSRNARQGGVRLLGDTLGGGDREQLLPVQRAAELGLLQRRAHVDGTVQVERCAHRPNPARLGEDALSL